MSLDESIKNLATRIGQEVKTVEDDIDTINLALGDIALALDTINGQVI